MTTLRWGVVYPEVFNLCLLSLCVMYLLWKYMTTPWYTFDDDKQKVAMTVRFELTRAEPINLAG